MAFVVATSLDMWVEPTWPSAMEADFVSGMIPLAEVGLKIVRILCHST